MTKTWLISDTHFGHHGVCNVFMKQDGTPLRPFSSIEEMDEMMIKNWNDVVGEKDRVYHLGDVVINRRFLKTVIPRLMGRKALIMGNHDLFKVEEYLAAGFDKILSSTKLDTYMLTHIPIHPNSMPRWCTANIHGHLHSNVHNDPKYINVGVEQLDFKPIDFEAVKKRVAQNQLKFKQSGRVMNWAYPDQDAWKPEGLSHDKGPG